MTKEVAGIPLTAFEDPIQLALQQYSGMTGEAVTFDDPNQAAKLKLTPEKPYSARSTTQVSHLGETAGTLYVIAFAPYDGTGDENTYNLAELEMGRYQAKAKYVPRSKEGVHTEAHLTISSHRVDAPNAAPGWFTGSLDVLGFTEDDPAKVQKIAEIGQTRGRFGANEGPIASATVGYLDLRDHWNDRGERFNDPHAIYNPWPDKVQICGFLAISNADADTHLDALRRLKTNEPTFV